ncbi:MAG: septum formation initiator family protein [Pyrinomonadaceae bacterium]|nr:septum formation initiator family protein [Pyrinomonadaceae bacterium]
MRTRKPSKTAETRRAPAVPMWAAFAIVISISVMLCLTINYRAFSVMTGEQTEHDQLSTKIQSITDENLQLQEEIHSLKSDARVIEREARRLGLVPKAKVSVPTN